MQKLNVILVALLMLGSFGVMAQAPNEMQTPELKEDFKKDDLKSFVNASSKVETLQAGAQKSMADAVKAEGLTVEKFNTIAQGQQNAGGPEEAASDNPEDKKMFDKASAKILEIQEEVIGEIQETIKKEGLDVQTYEQIIYAYQNSEKVKGEVDEIVAEVQQGQQAQPASPMQ